MKLPPIDLSKLLHLLKAEGKTELIATRQPQLLEITSKNSKSSKNLGSNMSLMQEWDNIVLVLEKEVIPLLSKGCEAKALAAPAQKLAKSAGSLSLMASQVLSFVPGPIGIICSIVNAIVCFSSGNVIGGLLELLGCIPGGKVAGKAASKLAPKFEKLLIEIVQSNHTLKVIVETSSKQSKVVTEFFKKYAPKTKPKDKVGYTYGTRTSTKTSMLEQSMRQPLHPTTPKQKQPISYYENTYYTRSEISRYTMSPSLNGTIMRPQL